MSKVGQAIHTVYKERAQKGGDILWHVKIKGEDRLTDDVPLHMSLKVFEDKKDMNLDEIKEKIKQFDITKPNPDKLKFKTTIFTSERDGEKYYMLLVENTDPSYEKFYNSMKHCGTVYKKFMPHVTINEKLYDKINKEGLKPEEVEFSPLRIEAGTDNTVHEFKKSISTGALKESAFYVRGLFGSSVMSLPNDVFKNWLLDNPNYAKKILTKHEERAKLHFGHDSELYKIALNNGVAEVYKRLNKK